MKIARKNLIEVTEEIDIDLDAILASVDQSELRVPLVGTWLPYENKAVFGDNATIAIQLRDYRPTVYVSVLPDDRPADAIVGIAVEMQNVSSGRVSFDLASGFRFYAAIVFTKTHGEPVGVVTHVHVCGDYSAQITPRGEWSWYLCYPTERAEPAVLMPYEPSHYPDHRKSCIEQIAQTIADRMFVGIEPRWAEDDY